MNRSSKFSVANSMLVCLLQLYPLSAYGGTRTAPIAGAGSDGVHSDAFGDAQDTFGAGQPLLDIDVFDIRYDAENVYFTIGFHTPIAPASQFQPDSLGGFLEFDIDENLVTGVQPAQNSFSPPFATLMTGNDFLLDFFAEQGTPGFAQLMTPDFNLVDLIPLTFEEMAVHGVISLSSLGGDDGRLNFTAVFGTPLQPTDATDSIGTSYAVVIPEPGAAMLLMITLAIPVCRRQRKSAPLPGNRASSHSRHDYFFPSVQLQRQDP